MYRYSITPAGEYNMSVRPAPGSANSPIGQLNARTSGQGDVLEITPSGDQWLYIEAGGTNKGVPVRGWVAVIHNGKRYCTLTDHQPDTPDEPTPPVSPFPKSFTLINDETGERSIYFMVE